LWDKEQRAYSGSSVEASQANRVDRFQGFVHPWAETIAKYCTTRQKGVRSLATGNRAKPDDSRETEMGSDASACNLAPSAPGASVSVQHQNSEFRIGSEFAYPYRLSPQYFLGIPRWVCPTPEPYYLGRWSYSCRKFVEV
jgi:hypothetical protein